jgi:hypothetical protein
VIRHIADHFWINTAGHVTARPKLTRISKIRLYRGKSCESENHKIGSEILNNFQTRSEKLQKIA